MKGTTMRTLTGLQVQRVLHGVGFLRERPTRIDHDAALRIVLDARRRRIDQREADLRRAGRKLCLEEVR
jgi:hypothetical protein